MQIEGFYTNGNTLLNNYKCTKSFNSNDERTSFETIIWKREDIFYLVNPLHVHFMILRINLEKQTKETS